MANTSIEKFHFYAGVFLVTAATLMLQIIQTRILSVVAWYHLAFFAISTAMFGLTLGAVWVYLKGDRFSKDSLSYDLAHYSSAFAITTGLALVLQMLLSPIVVLSVNAAATWFVLALCLSVPFFFSGVIVSLALTRSPYPIGRVYGVDLVGAAFGCLGVLVLLNLTDGPSAVIWVAAVAALAAISFAKSAIGRMPNSKPMFTRLLERRLTLFFTLSICAFVNGQVLGQAGLRPIFVKENIEALAFGKRFRFEEWNSFSRIIAARMPQRRPIMWGPSPKFDPALYDIDQMVLNIDGDSGTIGYGINGDLSKAEFLKFDVTNLAYHLPNLERAAIIGIGGGRDMLSAKLFGVPNVTGVEINPIFVHFLTGHPRFIRFVGLDKIDGFDFQVDEARSWFARSTDQFDVIQMSLIDTWAATSAGAFTLTENGLYTVEAWRIFLRRLESDGVFTISRWISPDNVNETGRLVSLAMATLMAEGKSNARDHLYMASSGDITTLVMSSSPFSNAQLKSLDQSVLELEFKTLIHPKSAPSTPVLTEIVTSKNRQDLEEYTSSLLLDLTPPTDSRPFFFNILRLSDAARMIVGNLTSDASRFEGIVKIGNLYATVTLLVLFFISFLLVLFTIVIPLRHAIHDIGGRLVYGGTAYFYLIGAGFMLIEIALLQRLSVFLGHPIYSLSVVLFSLVLSTGIGSLLSDGISLKSPSRFVSWAVAVAVYAMGLTLWMPELLLSIDGESLLVRGLTCIAIVAPSGILMGFGFPTGMKLISAVDRRPTPWFWGINGAAGVMASSLAVACSIAFGIDTTLVIGALCYLLLIPAALTVGFEKVETMAQRSLGA